MNVESRKRRKRRKRRKNILEWYRFLKRTMKDRDEFCLGLNYMYMPAEGQREAARLLCLKNEALEIADHPKFKGLVLMQRLKWKNS